MAATAPTIRVSSAEENEPDWTNAPAKSSRTTKTTTTTTTTRVLTAKAQADQSPESYSRATVEDLGRQANIKSNLPAVKHDSSVLSQKVEKNVNENVEGSKLVTTISTIAAQSGQSRIVLALLKDGDSFQLKIQEMRPAIFEVGLNYAECLKYSEEQQKLMSNLRKQTRTPVEGWLDKFELIKRTKEPNMSTERKLVYMCMVENLQACWKALLNQLEKRSVLLDEACKFYESCEQLSRSLDKAENHVQVFRQEFLNGPNSSKFNQAYNELKGLNRQILTDYERAVKNQQQLINLISLIGTENLGDARVNYILENAQDLIRYVETYLDPLERRKIQLESVITTTSTKTTVETTTKTNHLRQNEPHNQIQSNESNNSFNSQTSTRINMIREISNFNDLNLVENWLKLKIEQLNSSLLSSLGVSTADTRSILSKHEQISLECRAIEEATLNFNGRNIHAIKTIDPKDDKNNGDKSLFEQQKLLAIKARDVITILDARVVLLRRTIEFYSRSIDGTNDIAKMMRRLQVDNSLQSVHFVTNELETKDVSSIVASGATILSELQQLQLAQQHGERSRIVNLNLVTIGIRSVIDQLNQDLAHLKTVLNQRKLKLLNEDGTKMVNNFLNKCNQLQFWLNNHAKSFLIANNRLNTDADQVRSFCDSHDQLRVALQNKTLEVEALLRSLPTLSENLDPKSKTADEIMRTTDELRQDWINVTNCLDRRYELARKYLAILQTMQTLDKELDLLEQFNRGGPIAQERTDEDIRSNIEQNFAQLNNQVKNLNLNANKESTELRYSTGTFDDNNSNVLNGNNKTVVNDLNKKQVVDYADGLLNQFAERRKRNSDLEGAAENAPIKQPAHQRPQQLDPPRFTHTLTDMAVEPFSNVELECETIDANCQIEWFMNNFKKIPPTIKHSAISEGVHHKLIISNFSPICCGTYQVRASNSAGQAISQCKLRLAGIQEVQDEFNQHHQATTTTSTNQRHYETLNQNFQSSSPAVSSTSSFSQWRPNHQTDNSPMSLNKSSMARIIQGVESPSENYWQQQQQQLQKQQQSSTNQSVRISQLTSDSETTDTISTSKFPVTLATYSGPKAAQQRDNHLRVDYIDSPVSSTSLSRSVSKSPFEGTPQPPVFMQALSDSLPNSESRAGLVCLVVGNPPPTIEWLHNNQTIATTKCPKSSTCPHGSICKLTIETMNPRTQGQYECKASNRVGQSSTVITLTK